MKRINPTPWSVKIWSYETDYGDDNGEFHQAASIVDAKGNCVASGLKVETARLIADSVNSRCATALAEEQPADPKVRLRQIETEIALLSRGIAEKKRERAQLLQKRGVYLCVVCNDIQVFPEDGQNTCPDCITSI